MADYIDREELLKLYGIEELGDVNINELQVPFMVVRQNIIDMIPADVKPVVHGHWVRCKTNIGLYQCSRCNFPEHEQYGILGNYCRNCGAKMEADDERKL